MIVERITGIDALPSKAEHAISCENWVDAPDVHARFSIRHDGNSIYLYYQVEEPQVRAVNTEFNSPVWEDSCVEFFFTPEGAEGYYNFEFNAIGTVLGAYGKDRHQRNRLPADLLQRIEVLPSLGREPFEEQARRTTWNLQVRIPVDILIFSNIDHLQGVSGKANFYKCGDRLTRPHFLSWKPVEVPEPDFHLPRYFGPLSFE